MIRFGVTPAINAVATMLIGFSMLLVFVALYLNRGRSTGSEPLEEDAPA